MPTPRSSHRRADALPYGWEWTWDTDLRLHPTRTHTPARGMSCTITASGPGAGTQSPRAWLPALGPLPQAAPPWTCFWDDTGRAVL